MTRYRIVRDAYLGYTLQLKRRWWFGWWEPGMEHLGTANTFSTIDRAINAAHPLTRPRYVVAEGML